MENRSLKPQVQGEEAPDNDQEAIKGSKSFSLKIFKQSLVMLNIISKSMIFWGCSRINENFHILCNVML